jgi:hypothetical protein
MEPVYLVYGQILQLVQFRAPLVVYWVCDLGCSGVVNTFIAIAQALQGAMKSTIARLKGLLAIGNLQHLSFSHASLHSHWGDGSGSGDKHFFLAFVSLRTSALLLERAGRIVSYFQKSMFVVISLLCLVHPG